MNLKDVNNDSKRNNILYSVNILSNDFNISKGVHSAQQTHDEYRMNVSRIKLFQLFSFINKGVYTFN